MKLQGKREKVDGDGNVSVHMRELRACVRQRERERERQRDRQTDRQADRQTDRQEDRQRREAKTDRL